MSSIIFFFRNASTQTQSYDWGPMMRGWGFGMGWYWPPIIIVVSFAAIIIGIVVLVLRGTPSRRRKRNREDSAVDIMKKKYSRGEISKEEFEEKKGNLRD
jgi:putative membrane protein